MQVDGAVSPALGYYQYSTSFDAEGGTYNGGMSLVVDKTTEIFLNGDLVWGYTPDAHCFNAGVNCRTTTYIPVSAITLNSGTNTLTFVVEQAGLIGNGDPGGITFQAVGRSIAPEPNSLVLLGTGLLGATGLYFRRRVTPA